MKESNELQQIEKIARAILRGEKSYKGIELPASQKYGTDYQKKTYAMIKANELINKQL
tara:strand:- start:508 stop:681 length:174 start_codon:yes stop_codon:yes gene_type:complete